MLLGSASKLHLSLKCPASVHLPQEEPPAFVRAAGERGTAIHKELQHNPKPEHAGYWSVLREQAFVYNVTSGEAKTLDGTDREYGELKPDDVPGTADCVLGGFRSFEIVDYKTGKEQYATPPRDNPQLNHLALCAWRSLFRQATHAALSLQFIRATGASYTTSAIVDVWSLSAFSRKLRSCLPKAHSVRSDVDAGKFPKVNPGEWCRLCHAKCPERIR